MKNVVKNILALLLGVIFAIFIMEGVLRIHNPFDFRVKGDKIILPANKRYVFHAMKDRSPKFDRLIIHTKNSLGFRGEEPPGDFEKHLTIITVGGSTTECTFLSDGKTWTDVLGKKLKGNFEDVWINNAGIDGQSTFGHAILMENYITRLKPDVVLFLIGANDEGREDLGEYDKGMIKDRVMVDSLEWFVKSMANHSEVISLAVNMYRFGKAVALGVEHRAIDFRVFKNVDLSKYSSDEMKKAEKKSLKKETRYLKGFEDRLKVLIKLSRDNHIDPVLITQPTLYGDFVDDVTNVNFAFTRHPWQILELYNDVTRKVGLEEGVFVIDLAREMPKSTRYYYDWFHFDNEGAEKVAEIIYNRLYPYLANKYGKYYRADSALKNKGEYSWAK